MAVELGRKSQKHSDIAYQWGRLCLIICSASWYSSFFFSLFFRSYPWALKSWETGDFFLFLIFMVDFSARWGWEAAASRPSGWWAGLKWGIRVNVCEVSVFLVFGQFRGLDDRVRSLEQRLGVVQLLHLRLKLRLREIADLDLPHLGNHDIVQGEPAHVHAGGVKRE